MAKRPILLKFVLHSERYVYKDLEDMLRSYEVFWKWHDSMWVIISGDSPSALAKKCKKHIQADDQLFVIEVTDQFSTLNLQEDQMNWLAQYVAK